MRVSVSPYMTDNPKHLTRRNSSGRLQLTAGGWWTQTFERVWPHTYVLMWSTSATWQLVGSKTPRTHYSYRKRWKL